MFKFNTLTTRTLAAALLLTGAGISTAQAYTCITNPAICIAICGYRTCEKKIAAAPSDANALARVPTADLKAEADNGRNAESMVRFLDAEVARRGTAGAAPQ